ncbi:MAG: tRNA (adenine(22)-N(1))-methyltransferase TrmK [Nitrospirota bacterium]|nr:tRNA (adenine(22)-N(1))-methyltransferase TrmK [Nitrospirota bacterium]
MFANIKQYLAVSFIRMVQKHGPHKVEVLGRTYEVSEHVFNPKYYYTSRFMAEHIGVTPDDIVLDMGTGSGIQAVTAAEKASRVIAVDINPEAVRLARKNVRANGVEDVVSVMEGDLFTPLDNARKFSVILFTPPYLEGRPLTGFDHALFDPDKILIRRFFTEAGQYLGPGGYVQMLYSSIAGHEHALRVSEQFGWDRSLIARGKTFTETFFIYKMTRQHTKGDRAAL